MNPAAAGLGRPLKYQCDSSAASVSTLNRASRSAAHMTKSTLAAQPRRGR